MLSGFSGKLEVKTNEYIDLVQQRAAKSTTLREKTHISNLGFGETSLADEHGIHIARIEYTHAVRSDNTAVVFFSQTSNFILQR